MKTNCAKNVRSSIPLMKTKRLPLIDTLRGLALVNMFVYHALWSMANLFGKQIDFLNSTPAYLWQQSGASLFILLSGFCWALTHKHLKRSLVVLGCAFFIFSWCRSAKFCAACCLRADYL